MVFVVGELSVEKGFFLSFSRSIRYSVVHVCHNLDMHINKWSLK